MTVTADRFSTVMARRRGVAPLSAAEAQRLAARLADDADSSAAGNTLAALNVRHRELEGTVAGELIRPLTERVWRDGEAAFDKFLDATVRACCLNRHDYLSYPDRAGNLVDGDAIAVIKATLLDRAEAEMRDALRGEGTARTRSLTRPEAAMAVPGELPEAALPGIVDYHASYDVPYLLADLLAARPEMAEIILSRAIYKPRYLDWQARYGKPGLAELCADRWPHALRQVWHYCGRGTHLSEPLRSNLLKPLIETELRERDRRAGVRTR